MSGGGAKKGERRGGRKIGSRNKATIEREEKARIEMERQAEVDRQRAAGFPETAAEAKAAGFKLAKDVLEEFMRLFAAMATAVQPYPTWHVEKCDGRDVRVNDNPDCDESRFRTYAELAVQAAKDLAPYQSPKLSTVVVGSAVVTEIEIIGGLPDEEDGGLHAVEDVPSDSPRLVSP